MRTPLLLLAPLALLSTLLPIRAARADACFPACRQGFVCAPDGRCVSECNPPCESGLACRAGQCASTKDADVIRFGSKPAKDAAEDSKSVTEDKGHDAKFALLAGGGAFVGRETVPGLVASFRYKTPGDHAFVVGPRLALGLPEGPDFVVLGNDAGYRGNFAKGSIQAGLLALAQPQVWLGGASSMLVVGGAAGGFVQIGRIEIQLPLGVGFGTLLDKPFEGRSRDLGAVFTASLLGGVTF